MEWNGGVDYWSGVLDWITGVHAHKISNLLDQQSGQQTRLSIAKAGDWNRLYWKVQENQRETLISTIGVKQNKGQKVRKVVNESNHGSMV